jgi:hypothetical protein
MHEAPATLLDLFLTPRMLNLPFCAPLQTMVFLKQQGCLTKLRPSRDSYRITAPYHPHEHQFDTLAQRSQASQDVLQPFRIAFLDLRQEDLRRLRSGTDGSQKGLIIASSATLLSAVTLSFLGFLSSLVSIACLLVSCSHLPPTLIQILLIVQNEVLEQLHSCCIGSDRR